MDSSVWNGTVVDGYPTRLREWFPSGFSRYLRLFHPFLPWGTDDERDPVGAPRMRRRAVADTAGVPFDGDLTWRQLEPVRPDSDEGRPLEVWEGELEPSTRSALFAHLDHQSSESVFFYFGIAAGVAGHEPVLYRAPCSAVDDVRQAAADEVGHPFLVSPELVWPPERSWVVCTDYALTSTYIGCDDVLAEELIADGALEVVDIDLDTRVD